jgi:hypothetical protein
VNGSSGDSCVTGERQCRPEFAARDALSRDTKYQECGTVLMKQEVIHMRRAVSIAHLFIEIQLSEQDGGNKKNYATFGTTDWGS